MSVIRLPAFRGSQWAMEAQATPGGDKATPETPVDFLVNAEPSPEHWPDQCGPDQVAEIVASFVTALNHADEATLRGLISNRSARLGSSQEPGLFFGLTMPVSQNDGLDSLTVDDVVAYAGALVQAGQAIILDSVTLSLDPFRSTSDPTGGEVAWINMTFFGVLDQPNQDQLLFSGKGVVQCGDQSWVAVWQAAALPPGARLPTHG